MLNVKVESQVFGNNRESEEIPDIYLKLASELITLRELISRSVHNQIVCMEAESLTQKEIEKRFKNQYLNDSEIDQLAIDGKISYIAGDEAESNVTVNSTREINRAISAFKQKKFKVFIDGEEITCLSDRRALYNGCVIKFIRLIPLVGG